MNDSETAALMLLHKFAAQTLQQLGAAENKRPQFEEERDGWRVGAALARLRYAEFTTNVNGKEGFRITVRGEMVATRMKAEAERRCGTAPGFLMSAASWMTGFSGSGFNADGLRQTSFSFSACGISTPISFEHADDAEPGRRLFLLATVLARQEHNLVARGLGVELLLRIPLMSGAQTDDVIRAASASDHVADFYLRELRSALGSRMSYARHRLLGGV